MTSAPCLLIGDIGGTNARFALANRDGPGYSRAQTLQCADYQGCEQAIRSYLKRQGLANPDLICLAVAGPVLGHRARITNNPWVVDRDRLWAEFGIESVHLLNDFQAIALSLPHLEPADQTPIGEVAQSPPLDDEHTFGVIGPGTGLGTAGLQGSGPNAMPICAEAGHIGFAPETERQLELMTMLLQRFDRVSTERLLSGPGIENIHWALSRLHGMDQEPRSASEIFASAGAGSEPVAIEAVDIFFEVLGQFAGDFALTINARGGVYVAGGIVKRYPDQLAASRFREGFERKGRYHPLMTTIPTWLITHPIPGLIGASIHAQQAHRSCAG